MVAYKRKQLENHQTFRPKTWSQSLTGGGRLLEVPNVRLFDWESFGGLDRRSLTRRGRLLEIPTLRVLVVRIGGRLWEVVAYERLSHKEVRLYLHFTKSQ